MNPSDQGEAGIYFDARSKKYAEERAKRLRTDAIGQHQAPTGKLSAFAQDPNADPHFTRGAVCRDAEVLVIGGGFGGLLTGVHLREAGIEDVLFVDKAGNFGGSAGDVDPAEKQRSEMRKMEKVRRRIDSIVADPATATALKPYFNYFCKRPGFSDDYLQCCNRPNVTLVDTEGRGVERITPKGVVVGGKEYELDLLVYATGFDFMTEYTRESGFHIKSRSGLSLDEHWATGARTLYGMMTRGFPNFFMMSLVQSGIAINYMPIAVAQTATIAAIIAGSLKGEIGTVEPTQEAEEAWVGEVLAGAPARWVFLDSCTPSYLNYEGQPPKAVESNQPYPGGAIKYLGLLEQQRAAGAWSNLETTGRSEI